MEAGGLGRPETTWGRLSETLTTEGWKEGELDSYRPPEVLHEAEEWRRRKVRHPKVAKEAIRGIHCPRCYVCEVSISQAATTPQCCAVRWDCGWKEHRGALLVVWSSLGDGSCDWRG